MPRHQVGNQVLDRAHRLGGERRAAVILDLDTDGICVHVGYRAPRTFTRVPGALILGDQVQDFPTGTDQVMGRDFLGRVTQQGQSFGAGNRRVMQYNQPDSRTRGARPEIR